MTDQSAQRIRGMFSGIECDLPLWPALCVEICKQDLIDLVEEQLLLRKYDQAKQG
jgi:hypothetical protein